MLHTGLHLTEVSNLMQHFKLFVFIQIYYDRTFLVISINDSSIYQSIFTIMVLSFYHKMILEIQLDLLLEVICYRPPVACMIGLSRHYL